MNKRDLIKEAEKRGYRDGTLIDYEAQLKGTDTLGSGEFDIKDGKLIKYEKKLKDDNPSFRRFDTIWSEDMGWAKIVNKAHGFSL
jgi:hypothetical protein